MASVLLYLPCRKIFHTFVYSHFNMVADSDYIFSSKKKNLRNIRLVLTYRIVI